jgi:hypothetical protein
MNMNKYATLAISALSDFVITAGTAYAAIASGGVTLPTMGQIIFCVVGGAVLAARGVKKSLSPPPV